MLLQVRVKDSRQPRFSSVSAFLSIPLSLTPAALSPPPSTAKAPLRIPAARPQASLARVERDPGWKWQEHRSLEHGKHVGRGLRALTDPGPGWHWGPRGSRSVC